jgi:hypothetical protein
MPSLSTRSTHSRNRRRAAVAALSVTAAVAALTCAAQSTSAAPLAGGKQKSEYITSTGLKAGQVKHVWLIILENKSYDATFTGLNQNTYLWKTLPSEGVLLKNYYGTGHFSMDNYISMVSGQGPQQDTQSDCSVENFDFGSDSTIVHSKTGANKGQVRSGAGANAANGMNGCTYPLDTPTLFNQFDAANVSWKGYAQDLHNQPNREDATCGGPGTAANDPTTNPTYLSATADHPFPQGVTSFTGAQTNDQYVAKHFPFPWFHSLIGQNNTDGTTTPALTEPKTGTNCDANHIANLDDANHGLFHDLQKESTTPAFSWITPNNCSDAHDAICKGNNLSGAFDANGNPIYDSPTANDPESTTPKNYTGGLYASDLFLKYYIPMIERSAAFKDGGLIDITFDEANPPFTYSGNSFNNANAYGPTLGDKPDASTGIRSDAAGETLFDKTVHTEPTGVNTPLKVDAQGNQLYPGPGDNGFIDRPPACTSTDPDVPADCVPGIIRAGSGTSPGARTDKVAASANSSFVLDPSIVADDTGRMVTDTTDTTGANGASPIPDVPGGVFVGAISDTGPRFPNTNSGSVVDGSFQLVDDSGNPVTPTGAVNSVTLSAEGDPNDLQPGQTPDPLWDADDATPGGGDTGSVLISPLIKPGTVSTRYYNHYSWLRTMEDIFQVDKGTDHTALPGGTVSGGKDGSGHLGFAGQKGLAPFGPDVFNNAGNGTPPKKKAAR